MARAWSACSRSIARYIDSIEVLRNGHVRRAKLYYLRGLRGKAARITEKQDKTRSKETGAA